MSDTNNFILAWRDSFLKHRQVTKDYTLAVAAAMPAKHYDFKPSPSHHTFTEHLVHLARGNSLYVSGWGPSPILAVPKETTKAEVSKYLEESFDQFSAIAARLSQKDLVRNDLGATYGPVHSANRCLSAGLYAHGSPSCAGGCLSQDKSNPAAGVGLPTHGDSALLWS